MNYCREDSVGIIRHRLDTVGVKRLRLQICDHTKDSLIVQLNAQGKAGLSVVLEDFGRTATTRGFDPRRTHIPFFDQLPRVAGYRSRTKRSLFSQFRPTGRSLLSQDAKYMSVTYLTQNDAPDSSHQLFH